MTYKPRTTTPGPSRQEKKQERRRVEGESVTDRRFDETAARRDARRERYRASIGGPCVRCGRARYVNGSAFMCPVCHSEVEREPEHERCPFPGCASPTLEEQRALTGQVAAFYGRSFEERRAIVMAFRVGGLDAAALQAIHGMPGGR